MTARINAAARRAARTAVVSCIVAATLAVAPAGAVAPPVIDPGALPSGEPFAPPTELRDPCANTTPVDNPVPIPAPQRSLDLRAVWPLSTGAGQVVAVIDTGVEPHPRLPGLIPGGDFVTAGDGTSDCDAHGTLVAGIIAAHRDGNTGFSGVAPDARILSIRQSSNIFRRTGAQQDDDGRNARGVGTLGSLAAAIRRATDLGATVINISEVACVPPGSGDNPALGAAIDYAARVHDVVIVAAAGNLDTCKDSNPAPNPALPHANPWDSVTTVATPAWYDDMVLAVGSVNPDGTPSKFTLPGPWVDVAAPGTSVTSLDPRRTQEAGLTATVEGGAVEGTSFAAPVVAGTAALIRARWPELSASEVIARIENTAHAPAAGWDPFVGHGVVDPLAAVTTARNGTVDEPRSVAVAGPSPVVPTDPRPRDVALAGTAIVLGSLVIGVLASIPVRRRALANQRGDTSSG